MTNPIKTARWQRFRQTILERDGRRCTTCGTVRQLQVHHKERRADSPDRIFDPSNCTTLCKWCHDGLHEKELPPERLEWRRYIKEVASDRTHETRGQV